MNVKGVIATGALMTLSVAYVAFSAPGRVAVTEEGEINGLINIARESLQGKRFWEQQLFIINSELARLRAQPESLANLFQKLEKKEKIADQRLEEFYDEFPEMRPSAAGKTASELRKQADAIEWEEMKRYLKKHRLEQIAALQKIHSIAVEHTK